MGSNDIVELSCVSESSGEVTNVFTNMKFNLPPSGSSQHVFSAIPITGFQRNPKLHSAQMDESCTNQFGEIHEKK